MTNLVTPEDVTRIEQLRVEEEGTYNPFIELMTARCSLLRALKGLEQDGKLTPEVDAQLNRIWTELYDIERDLKLPDALAFA